jgi:F-type H+-transporting ATPase subunit epsilon
MSGELKVTIRTPEGSAWQGVAEAMRIPAHVGSFGVLPNHAPLTALTGDGIMEVRGEDSTRWFVLAAGIAEVIDNSVTVLTDVAIQADDENDAVEKLERNIQIPLRQTSESNKRHS